MAAVREGTLSSHRAVNPFSLSEESVLKHLNGEVAADTRLGSNNVLTAGETVLVDALLWGRHHHLALGRSELVDEVRAFSALMVAKYRGIMRSSQGRSGLKTS